MALVAAIVIAAASAARCPAQQTPPQAAQALESEITALRQEYDQRIAALEQKLAELKASVQPVAADGTPALPPLPQAAAATLPAAASTPGSEVTAGPASTPPETTAPPPGPETSPYRSEPAAAAGGASQTSNYFNPSVSVIGNFLAVAGHNGVENLPSASLRESELGLQAIVDPYARADFFISFGEQGVVVEEGYLTFNSLPADLLAKVGRMRVSFGKINTMHLHVLPWPDEPLPIVNLLGSEDGWIGTGVSAARILPLPGDTFSEATVQIFRGENPGLFQLQKRSDLAYNLHYRVFRDLTEATNLDLGASYGWGPNGTSPNAKTRLSGIDATLRWKPLQTATYRSFTLRGELMRSQREQPGPQPSSIGWFLSGDWQLAKRWFVGGRYESSDHSDNDRLRDTGEALVLTFWPSEFSQLRGELRRRHYANLETANELLMQLQFAIGAHGAHPF